MPAPRLAKLEHLVVQDIFLTETAWHADVVLPASAHAEKLGTYTNTNRQVQIGRPALDLPGDARQDSNHHRTRPPHGPRLELRRCLGSLYRDGAGHALAATTSRGTASSARNRSSIRPTARTCPATRSSSPRGFPTADGRGRIVPADLLPPDEVPDEEYPLVLTTGRMLEHWHTGAMTRRAGVLDAIEPQGIAAMNPYEIERAGPAVGDMIQVETRRGTVEAILRADREVADGMVFMPFCFNESPANRLTNPMLDPYGKIPEFKYCAARVAPLAQKVEAADQRSALLTAAYLQGAEMR